MTQISGYVANFSAIDYILLFQQTSVIIRDSIQEILKIDSWKTKLEINVFALFCITLLSETILLAFVWNKYADKIRKTRSPGERYVKMD